MSRVRAQQLNREQKYKKLMMTATVQPRPGIQVVICDQTGGKKLLK